MRNSEEKDKASWGLPKVRYNKMFEHATLQGTLYKKHTCFAIRVHKISKRFACEVTQVFQNNSQWWIIWWTRIYHLILCYILGAAETKGSSQSASVHLSPRKQH